MKFEKQRFTQDVTLDHNQFIDCEIRGCTVFYHGGEFSLVNTHLHNVKFALAGPANATLSFLRMLRTNSPHLVEELLAGGEPVRTQTPLHLN